MTDSVESSTHRLDLWAASRDLWPGGTLDFWQDRDAPLPDRVYWPESETAVEHVLKSASERGIPVVTYGAGSGVCGGARGRVGSVVLDTKRMDHIGPLDEHRWTVDAEAGVNGQHLEDWLRERGYTLGHSPSSIWCSTVGGWAAARSAGQFSSRYGVFEDMVLGVRAVSPGRPAFGVGELGDADPEWLDLLLGSEGTLAVITKVRMRVWPIPKERWLRGYRMATVEDAVRAMRELMQGELWPSVVRLYDPVDTRIGGRTKPKDSSNSPPSEARRFYREWLLAIEALPPVRKRLLSWPLALPGVVNAVFDRAASGCLLVVGWEGEPDVVHALSTAGHRMLCSLGEDLGEGPGERWFHSRHAVSYKLMPIFERGGFADTMEVAARWSHLIPLYHAVREALGETAVVMAHMSHVYPEGGSIYFSFAGRGDSDVYARTWQSALEAVIRSGGTVTHHHGVGQLKAEAASSEVGPAVAGWKALKQKLDPSGIMNPGCVFVDVPYRDPGLPSALGKEDGLTRTKGQVPADAMWPWERLPGPPRWQRLPWQVGWSEVSGVVAGRRCTLGRGPRSAAGPDLRGWLTENGEHVTTTVPVVREGLRWMGFADVEVPAEVALNALRSDLRPALMYWVSMGDPEHPEGVPLPKKGARLFVGFRGPGARSLGAIASELLGLEACEWQPARLPSGPFESCALDDPRAITVTLSGAMRKGDT